MQKKGRQPYLLHTTELVHGALVMLHTVLSKVQVGRILGKAQDSVKGQSLTHGTLSVLTKDSNAHSYDRKCIIGRVG